MAQQRGLFFEANCWKGKNRGNRSNLSGPLKDSVCGFFSLNNGYII